jgi:hypothetical protein
MSYAAVAEVHASTNAPPSMATGVTPMPRFQLCCRGQPGAAALRDDVLLADSLDGAGMIGSVSSSMTTRVSRKTSIELSDSAGATPRTTRPSCRRVRSRRVSERPFLTPSPGYMHTRQTRPRRRDRA